ncbi:20409_t:CDS:2, partial [Gigaspora rosea]
EFQTYIQRTIIQSDNKSIIVREISHELEVLDLHKILIPVITQINKNNSDANDLAGYYAYQPSKKDSIIWVPLLSGYTIYTKINDNYFKLSIMKDTNNRLIYQWYFYVDDEAFKIFKDSGQDNICFKTCFNKFKWSDNRSPLWYLGISDKDNIQFLQEIIMRTYPNIFNHYSQTVKAFNTEKTLKNSLTCTKYQLQTAIEVEETPIRKGIVLNKFRKYLSPHETQALMVENNTLKNELKNTKKTIMRLKEKITKLTYLPDEDIDQLHDKILCTTIDDLIEKWKIGSTLLVDTKTYLSLVFEKLCNNCGNYLISTRDCQLTVIEFKTKRLIQYKECKTIIEISNKKKNICFSKAVAAGGLGARISRHAAQSFLATITKLSASSALINCMNHTKKTLTEQFNSTKLELNEHEKILLLSFDVSWSHGRNAKQASGEFICYLEFE